MTGTSSSPSSSSPSLLPSFTSYKSPFSSPSTFHLSQNVDFSSSCGKFNNSLSLGSSLTPLSTREAMDSGVLSSSHQVDSTTNNQKLKHAIDKRRRDFSTYYHHQKTIVTGTLSPLAKSPHQQLNYSVSQLHSRTKLPESLFMTLTNSYKDLIKIQHLKMEELLRLRLLDLSDEVLRRELRRRGVAWHRGRMESGGNDYASRDLHYEYIRHMEENRRRSHKIPVPDHDSTPEKLENTAPPPPHRQLLDASRNFLPEFHELLEYYLHLLSLMRENYSHSASCYRRVIEMQYRDIVPELLKLLTDYYPWICLDELMECFAFLDWEYHEGVDDMILERSHEESLETSFSSSEPSASVDSSLSPHITSNTSTDNASEESQPSPKRPLNSFSFYKEYLFYLQSQERFQECHHVYQVLQQQHPTSLLMTDLFMSLVELFEKIPGKLSESIQLIRNSLEEHPMYKSRQLRIKLAHLYQQNNEREKAIEAWMDVLDRFDCSREEKCTYVCSLTDVVLSKNLRFKDQKHLEAVHKLLDNLVERELRWTSTRNVSRIQVQIRLGKVLWKLQEEDAALSLWKRTLQHIDDVSHTEQRLELNIQVHRILSTSFASFVDRESLKQSREHNEQLKEQQTLLKKLREKNRMSIRARTELSTIPERLASEVHEYYHDLQSLEEKQSPSEERRMKRRQVKDLQSKREEETDRDDFITPRRRKPRLLGSNQKASKTSPREAYQWSTPPRKASRPATFYPGLSRLRSRLMV